MVVDPLPFVPCHPENSPNRREIAVHCCRFNLPAQQPLADLPNHVPINIGQIFLPKNRVENSTDALYIPDASKRSLYFEIPDYGFLPRTLGLHPEICLPECLALESGYQG